MDFFYNLSLYSIWVQNSSKSKEGKKEEREKQREGEGERERERKRERARERQGESGVLILKTLITIRYVNSKGL